MKVQRLLQVLLSAQLWAMAVGRTRIIGGEEAEAASFPYTVTLQDDLMGHSCGGSLISGDVVITAAHCRGGLDIAKAVVGPHNLYSGEGQAMSVASTLPHPNFNPETVDNDVMLVFLTEPVDPSTEYVRLNADASAPAIGASVTVAGWGLTSIDAWFADVSEVLMATDVNILSNDDCEASAGTIGGFSESYAGDITDNMLCAQASGKDSCQGDSGGPMVQEDSDGSHTLVGIISWGYGCAEEAFPGVYSRVSSSYEWIRTEVCRRSTAPPAEYACDEIDLVDSTPVCKDTTNWVDAYGDGCDWYEQYDYNGCPMYGDVESAMGPASEKCCYCGGGEDPNFDEVANAGSNDIPPTPTAAPCVDTPGWQDTFGDGCSWYEAADFPGCKLYGSAYSGDMGVANDNCCYCMD